MEIRSSGVKERVFSGRTVSNVRNVFNSQLFSRLKGWHLASNRDYADLWGSFPFLLLVVVEEQADLGGFVKPPLIVAFIFCLGDFSKQFKCIRALNVPAW